MRSFWKPERRNLVALALLAVLLYLPFAGNYGMWDPWETHYSEVARQMLARGDYVSLWWPGSPQDRNEFWSKPVLTFWLIAMGMRVAGLGSHGPSLPMDTSAARWDGEMAVGWAAEWAARIPFILCSLACLWAVWELVRRLAGRRAAIWSVIVLATSSQYFFVTRQAMTDMAFVAPIAVALAMMGLAVMLPDEEVKAELPRRERALGRWKLSWPHAPIFYVSVGMMALAVLPQLVMISLQVKLALPIGNTVVRMSGVVPMLLYFGAAAIYVLLAMRARTKRQIYLHIAFLMGGISTLAKGPAGIALPVIAAAVYLILQGEYRQLLPRAGWWDDYRASLRASSGAGRLVRRAGVVYHFLKGHPLELVTGTLLFIAVAFPWYHAMLIRHGMGFWNEFIGDNYVHRAAGRHGDRGTFEYYILQIGYGMFPWTGVIVASILGSLRKLGGGDGRAKLRGFAVAWFLVIFGVMSLVNTKFHHYILPGLPALAILAGLWLDELTSSPKVVDALALLLVGVPAAGLVARDLAMYPARLSWLFDYDYVNAPGGGRPWPMTPEYDYSMRVAAWGVVVVAATVWLGLVALGRARAGAKLAEADDADARPLGGLALAGLGALMLGTFIAAQSWQPPFLQGPKPLADGWILVGAAGGLAVLVMLAGGLRAKATRWATSGLAVTAIVACLWTGWALDRYLTDLSPHWSQKHVIAKYYELRSGPEEPLIAYNMYWRGETFYTKNAIYDHRKAPGDKTVFLQEHAVEKLKQYVQSHPGRRIFFIVERSRLESLRSVLPEASRSTLKALDETNNKIYLAVAQI